MKFFYTYVYIHTHIEIGRTHVLGHDESGTGDEVCTLVFTSGSEGRPKAVMITHTNHVIQALEKIAQVPGLSLGS